MAPSRAFMCSVERPNEIHDHRLREMQNLHNPEKMTFIYSVPGHHRAVVSSASRHAKMADCLCISFDPINAGTVVWKCWHEVDSSLSRHILRPVKMKTRRWSGSVASCLMNQNNSRPQSKMTGTAKNRYKLWD